MLKSRDREERSLLAVAASSGNKDVFEAVQDAQAARLSEDEVRGHIVQNARRRKGTTSQFQHELLPILRLCPQVKGVMMSVDRGTRSLLAAAAESSSKAVFVAAIAAVRAEFPEDEVRYLFYCNRTVKAQLLENIASSRHIMHSLLTAY